MNGTKKYELDHLKSVIRDLQRICPELDVAFEFSGDYRLTPYGVLPTVNYAVSSRTRSQRIRSPHPLIIDLLPRRLAQSIRCVLDFPAETSIVTLIDRLQSTSVRGET